MVLQFLVRLLFESLSKLVNNRTFKCFEITTRKTCSFAVLQTMNVRCVRDSNGKPTANSGRARNECCWWRGLEV
jgi:hypothetical protein